MTVARMLGQTVAEIEQGMSNEELGWWIALVRLEADEKKKAIEKAKRQPRRR